MRDITGYNAAYDRGELAEPPALGEEPRAVRAAPVHPGRGRRAQRPHDGGGPRRRGLHLPHRPDGPGGRHPPGDRHPAPIGRRDHRRHQGQHPFPAGVRRVVAGRQPGHPRPARRRAADRQGRHAAADGLVQRRPPHPGGWVGEDEVRKVVAHWRRQSEPRYVEGVEGHGDEAGGPAIGGAGDGTTTNCWNRPRSWSCVRSWARRRCCSASSGSASPGPGGSWTCWSGGAWWALGGLQGPGRAHDGGGARQRGGSRGAPS